MNEYDVIKQSRYVYLGVVLLSLFPAYFFKQMMQIPLGITLGYILGLGVFMIIIKTTDLILAVRQSVLIIVMMHFIKLAVYALGFLLAIFIPEIFNLFGVLIGYMINYITISISPILEKRRRN